MADYDSALPVRGNVIDGATVYSQNTCLVVAGTDGSNYQAMSVDSSGQIELAHDVNTNPVFAKITDGTDEVDVVNDGDSGVAKGFAVFGYDGTNMQILSTDNNGQVQTAHDVNTNPIFGVVTDGTDDLSVLNDGDTFSGETGLLIMGQDGTNVQAIKTNTAGQLQVEVVSGFGTTEIYDGGSANLVKDTPTTIHSYSPASGTEYITGFHVSGSGHMKVQVKYGVTGSEVLKFTYFNGTAHPNIIVHLPEPIDLASTDTILIEGTNLENAASPASDFDGYATIIGHV